MNLTKKEIIDGIKAWGFQEDEITKSYQQKLDEIKSKSPNVSDAKMEEFALNWTIAYYKSLKNGSIYRKSIDFILLALSPVQHDMNKKRIEKLQAEFAADKVKFESDYGIKYKMEGDKVMAYGESTKNYFEIKPYDQSIAYGLVSDGVRFTPAVLDIRNDFAQKASGLKPFRLYKAEVSTKPREDNFGNVLYSGYTFAEKSPVETKKIWELAQKLPNDVLASVGDLQKVAIRSTQLKGFNVINGFVAINCTLTNITTASTGNFIASAIEGLNVASVAIPKELEITKKFGDNTNVIVFGKVLPSREEGREPTLWAWSIIEDYDKANVTAPPEPISKESLSNKEADALLNNDEDDDLLG